MLAFCEAGMRYLAEEVVGKSNKVLITVAVMMLIAECFIVPFFVKCMETIIMPSAFSGSV